MSSKVEINNINSKTDTELLIKVDKNLENESVLYFADEIDMAFNNGNRLVVLDFSQVEFLSSAGIGVIFSRSQKFKRVKRNLILKNVSKEITYIFKELGLLDFLIIHNDIDNFAKSISNK